MFTYADQVGKKLKKTKYKTCLLTQIRLAKKSKRTKYKEKMFTYTDQVGKKIKEDKI